MYSSEPLIGVAAALAARGTTPAKPTTPAIYQQFSLPDRVALITGGNSGLGLEAALAFLEAGARAVYCVDLPTQPSEAWSAVKEYAAATGLKGRLEYVQGDVTGQNAMWDIAQEIGDKEGRLDVCVASAGISDKAAPPLEYLAEDYDKIIDINLKGVLYTAQAAGRQMTRFGTPGSIILLASVAGLIGVKGLFMTGYYASKGGVVNLMRSLAVELAEKNIRVNSLSPGFMSTPMVTTPIAKSQEVEEFFRKQNPVQRIGNPYEIRGPMVWLASDASSFSTGSNIEVSGGHTAW
ncbi:sorbose reductase sou1 [Peniophora sp. CONT]|nr:sorbose reductase sou1 [Peniophora sp. CONT]